MAKRFYDTEKFKDQWYAELSNQMKVVWEFMLCDCDHAGLFHLNIKILEVYVGKINKQQFMNAFGRKIIHLKENIYFIPRFISFQYPKMTKGNKATDSVLRILEEYNINPLNDSGSYAPSKPLASPFVGVMDKDKDMDKDMDKDLDKEKESLIKIIDYLNLKTSKSFRTGSVKTRTLVYARLEEGFTLDNFYKVIDNKCSAWLKDDKMNQYLRPETLFSNKFEGYLNEQPKPKIDFAAIALEAQKEMEEERCR